MKNFTKLSGGLVEQPAEGDRAPPVQTGPKEQVQDQVPSIPVATANATAQKELDHTPRSRKNEVQQESIKMVETCPHR
jgi:hypothetical protein